ncbi:MAG: hypothetical protein ACXQT4_03120 [Methanotrichaceae archaeon]
MLLHEMLKVEEQESIFLAEESLADLITLPVTSEILESDLAIQESIEIRDDSLLGVVFKLTQPAKFWLLLTDRYSDHKVLEKIAQNLDSEQVRVSENEFLECLVEYFAISLKEELFCQSCPVVSPPLHIQDRIERLEEFLGTYIPSDLDIMEICCGNGMATQSLKRQGFEPWTEDSDNCEICQALKAGYLNPRRSMVLDVRLLNCFFRPKSFGIVMGFMVGLIDDVNWSLWKDILLQSSVLARNKVLYTTYTEKEARLVADAFRSIGWEGEVIDNRDSMGIYDQWAYVAER